jgi:hypothetical protein
MRFDQKVAILRARGALPPWFDAVDGWAERLHANLTRDWKELPLHLGVFTGGRGPVPTSLPDAIDVPRASPVFLAAIQEATFKAVRIVKGAEAEPARPGWSEFAASLQRLCQVVGAIRDASFPLFKTSTTPWSRPVQAASRFFYWHELAHVMLGHFTSHDRTRREMEIAADQIAFSGLFLEFRKHQELIDLAFIGPALAIAYIGHLERSEPLRPISPEKQSYPSAFERLSLLIGYAESEGLVRGVQIGEIAARISDAFDLFMGSHDFPIRSPIKLYLHTIVTPSDDRRHFVEGLNELMQWHLFATQARVEASCATAWSELTAEMDEAVRRRREFLDYCASE